MTAHQKIFPDTIDNNPYKGKNILVIGDSQSATGEWPSYLGFYLDANVTVHAKGGIGMLQMVDGDMPIANSENIDPSTYGVDYIARLTARDVCDKDLIIVMGLYNEVDLFIKEFGSKTDRYPQEYTFCARYNHLIDRIRGELSKAGNEHCQILVTNMHRCGGNAFQPKTSYEYGEEFTDSLRMLSLYRNVKFSDIMHNCVIDSTNWSIYQKCTFINPDLRVKYPNASTTSPDNLHLNSKGMLAVAHCLAILLSQ